MQWPPLYPSLRIIPLQGITLRLLSGTMGDDTVSSVHTRWTLPFVRLLDKFYPLQQQRLRENNFLTCHAGVERSNCRPFSAPSRADVHHKSLQRLRVNNNLAWKNGSSGAYLGNVENFFLSWQGRNWEYYRCSSAMTGRRCWIRPDNFTVVWSNPDTNRHSAQIECGCWYPLPYLGGGHDPFLVLG